MEIIEQKAQHKEITTKAPAPRAPTNVVDLVKVLQDSLNRTQSLKQKRSATRPSARSSDQRFGKTKAPSRRSRITSATPPLQIGLAEL